MNLLCLVYNCKQPCTSFFAHLTVRLFLKPIALYAVDFMTAGFHDAGVLIHERAGGLVVRFSHSSAHDSTAQHCRL